MASVRRLVPTFSPITRNWGREKVEGDKKQVPEGFFPSSTPFLLSLPPIIESGWKKWKSRKEKIGKNREIGFPKI